MVGAHRYWYTKPTSNAAADSNACTDVQQIFDRQVNCRLRLADCFQQNVLSMWLKHGLLVDGASPRALLGATMPRPLATVAVSFGCTNPHRLDCKESESIHKNAHSLVVDGSH